LHPPHLNSAMLKALLGDSKPKTRAQDDLENRKTDVLQGL